MITKFIFRKGTSYFTHRMHAHRKTFYVLQHKFSLYNTKKTRSIRCMLRVLPNFPVVVRLIGLEPTRITTPDPKSGASTNFATSAKAVQSYTLFFELQVI